jgi:hypothetical protein
MIFCTTFEYYDYLVILFRIANISVLFQNIINKIFKDIINLSIVTYINNIHIYSQLNEEYKKFFKEIYSHLHEQNIPTSINKCEFHDWEIEFSDYTISNIRSNVGKYKVVTILVNDYLNSQKIVQVFMEFANIYSYLINDFSKLA